MNLYTIGFSKKTAEQFFGLLKEHHVQRVIDVRLKPTGQLAGFTKSRDLEYFLRELLGCTYSHLEILAPEAKILLDYREDHDWPKYVKRFEALLDERNIPKTLDRMVFEENNCCLLCSEATPDWCHRRLVGERLAQVWPGVKLIHL